MVLVIFKNSKLTIWNFSSPGYCKFDHSFQRFSQALIFLFELPFQACGTQNWPHWNGKIEWQSCEKNKKESDRLRYSLKEVIKKCENLRRKIQKRGISDFENDAEFLQLDNEPFISSKLYENLFPPITIEHTP